LLFPEKDPQECQNTHKLHSTAVNFPYHAISTKVSVHKMVALINYSSD